MALPPEIAGHLNLDGKPVTPRPSATVLLIRDGDPWELLLVHRPGGAAFGPGAYVFPGGTVHDDDREWGDEIAAAAIRELFEETGILLARRGRDFANDADCAALRSATARSTSFGDAMRGLGLEPSFDELVLFTRWVTPAQLRRRFDARFFLARLPGLQTIHPQEGEVTDWRRPSAPRAPQTPHVTLVFAAPAIPEWGSDQSAETEMLASAPAVGEVPLCWSLTIAT